MYPVAAEIAQSAVNSYLSKTRLNIFVQKPYYYTRAPDDG